MLRIGSMNMLQHGVEAPDIRYRDSLSAGASPGAEKYTLVLANPPFAGSLDYETTSKDLQRIVKTKKTELLFLALFLELLKAGGRAAVIMPDGVLFGSSTAHKALRKILVDDQKLDAVVKLPSGVFRPYAGHIDHNDRVESQAGDAPSRLPGSTSASLLLRPSLIMPRLSVSPLRIEEAVASIWSRLNRRWPCPRT
jgi:hypothetical protein